MAPPLLHPEPGEIAREPITATPRRQRASATSVSTADSRQSRYRPPSMITVGIDMASQAPRTASCQLRWRPGSVEIAELRVGLEDEDLRSLLEAPSDKIGIDVPLGWPADFVEAVGRQFRGEPLPDVPLKNLTHRATDRALGEAGCGWPLSVSTDRLAYPALRAARLLTGVDRSGAGQVVEVYPALALRVWGLPHGRYKGAGNRDALGALIRALTGALPALELTEGHEAMLRSDDNATDALVAALVARAAAVGLCTPVPPDQTEAAHREGWIATPLPHSLGLLVGGATPPG